MQIGMPGYSTNRVLFGITKKAQKKNEKKLLKQQKALDSARLNSEHFKNVNINIAKNSSLQELSKPITIQQIISLHKDYNIQELSKIQIQYGYFTPLDMAINNAHITVPEHKNEIIAAFHKRGAFTVEETAKKNKIVNQILTKLGKVNWQGDVTTLLQNNKDFKELPEKSALRNAIIRAVTRKSTSLSQTVSGTINSTTSTSAKDNLQNTLQKFSISTPNNSKNSPNIWETTLEKVNMVKDSTRNFVLNQLYNTHKRITSGKVEQKN